MCWWRQRGGAVRERPSSGTVGPELQLFINLETTKLHGSWAGLSSLGGNKGCQAALSVGGGLCAWGTPSDSDQGLLLIRELLWAWISLHVKILLRSTPPSKNMHVQTVLTNLEAASHHSSFACFQSRRTTPFLCLSLCECFTPWSNLCWTDPRSVFLIVSLQPLLHAPLLLSHSPLYFNSYFPNFLQLQLLPQYELWFFCGFSFSSATSVNSWLNKLLCLLLTANRIT